mmetsp:Transcript_13458/g.29224  ORF Transcript_13458/g.29224 Transcript_13458/m.29224 type:complete len:629 (-) Transcript_13458:283-2169(-)|eukprot:CAMPEP_0172299398 /NCGR_PEP_ID=MMETSP1058-20130122/1727_1 /TAXON_ID=83371 /ORGANISM="Detonula confervacea, Strain CCMP 353" /LENGTH=628 /DNA_ID=CAMNT_0013008845 /DNA_START=88 /DNA_END=1974 /DNA_ORIENTATION=-
MKSLTLLALSSCIISPSLGFAPPQSSFRVSTGYPQYCPSATRLQSTPEPLATEGDWSAYLDDETTGYVYYFNSVSGESLWERPTETFPIVDGTSGDGGSTREEAKEDRKAERAKRREQKKKEREDGDGGGGGIFGALFGGGGKEEEPTKSKTTEQLSELQTIANNDEFLNELDQVIAEAEEAIAIADKVEEAPSKNKGGFFSSLGFVSGKEAIEEAETLIADAEERTSKAAAQEEAAAASSSSSSANIFSGFSFGARGSPKVEKKADPIVVEEPEPVEESLDVWVEGLKNLFQKTFDDFTLPKTTTTSEKKVVAVDNKTPKDQKAEVSDSDFLDVIWGAETSARPTLNIAEMMKAFQVQSDDDTATTTAGSKEEGSEAFKTLALDVALSVRAHPEKVSWGGEDAGFSMGRTFGIFDGVSGAEKEKGKKLYSRSLAETMKKKTGKPGLNVKEITGYMDEAKELADAEATGASTAVVGSIGEDNVLRALNIGDSVCLVLRDGSVAARTREIIHYFDCPYQLGDDSPDRPRDGTTLQAEIFRGDVIVAGSDGVFDNLSDADICEIVSAFGPRTKASTIAKKIVDKSRSVSLDPMAVTPYSTVARGKSGYSSYRDGKGGKVDDVSCIVVKTS